MRHRVSYRTFNEGFPAEAECVCGWQFLAANIHNAWAVGDQHERLRWYQHLAHYLRPFLR